MTNHTPEEWAVAPEDATVVRSVDFTICEVHIHPHSQATRKHAEERAQLIAAAPELLEAARKAYDMMQSMAIQSGTVLALGETFDKLNVSAYREILETAIAKAEGRVVRPRVSNTATP